MKVMIRFKGGPGSGHFGHSGRPGQVGGSSTSRYSISKTSGRVWTGEQHEATTKLTKLEKGEIGEQVAMRALEDRFGVNFSTLNVGVNNAPIDVGGDHMAVEVKASQASGDVTSQYWRATIGQPGKAESALFKQMTREEKIAYNKIKYDKILERKNSMLAQMSEMAGAEVKPYMVGVIISGDGKKADAFLIPGFHIRVGWKQNATDDNYLGTYEIGVNDV